MWEAQGLKNEDFLWAGTVLRGGIAGQQQATCGAVASGAVFLGLKNRRSLADKEKTEKARKNAYEDAAEMVKSFIEKFGAVSCIELTGVDFSDEEATKKAYESGQMRCNEQAQFVVEKLYELGRKRGGVPER